MSQWSDNLYSMAGKVLSFRPRVSYTNVQGWLNDRVRQALEQRPYWSDLMERRILSIPARYATGTVTVTLNSKTVTGSATAWPVSDATNTTISAGVSEIGYVEITPASMTGITEDSTLYVDSAGTPEAVPVVEITSTTFIGKFAYTHAAGCTVTQSSLVGRQFRLDSSTPIFNVRAVHNATELELDVAWGTTSVSNSAYEIFKIYYSFGHDLKDIHVGMDSEDGTPIRLHVQLQEMNFRDPQRSTTGSGGLIELVDWGPSENGAMLYELWPPQSSARQVWFMISKQWPEMKNDTDRPPPFINPTVFVNGAIADALNFKVDGQDVYHNPRLAQIYELKYQQGLLDAIHTDDAKMMRNYSYEYERMMGGPGSAWWQSHDPSALAWDM